RLAVDHRGADLEVRQVVLVVAVGIGEHRLERHRRTVHQQQPGRLHLIEREPRRRGGRLIDVAELARDVGIEAELVHRQRLIDARHRAEAWPEHHSGRYRHGSPEPARVVQSGAARQPLFDTSCGKMYFARSKKKGGPMPDDQNDGGATDGGATDGGTGNTDGGNNDGGNADGGGGETPPTVRTCGTMESYQLLVAADPQYADRLAALETTTTDYI